MDGLTIKTFKGAAVRPHLAAMASLRIRIFRDFPYLYDGSEAYEADYLQTYSECPEGFVALVFNVDGAVVGMTTAIPLEHETPEFTGPFIDAGYDPCDICYLGESVLDPAYRGQGVGVRFFAEREAYARSLGRFRWTAFCAVDRPGDHPLRPADYVSLDGFWKNRGYRKHPEWVARFSWKDVDQPQETEKTLTFWMKPLDPPVS